MPIEKEFVLDALRAAFPPRVYTGKVTPADGEPFSEEIDDDLALWHYLSGKDWTSVEASFIDEQAGSLPLLTDDAFVAFLPAWLVRAMDADRYESDARPMVLIELSRELPNGTPDWAKLLNQQQVSALQMFAEYLNDANTWKPLSQDLSLLRAYLAKRLGTEWSDRPGLGQTRTEAVDSET